MRPSALYYELTLLIKKNSTAVISGSGVVAGIPRTSELKKGMNCFRKRMGIQYFQDFPPTRLGWQAA